MRTKKEKENEMIDLSKCTAKTACIKLYKGLKKDGYDVYLLKPEEAEKNGWGKAWYCGMDGGPYEALVWLSLGESMYTEPWTSNGKPEYKITGAKKYVAEPYYSYCLGFFPEN